MWHIVAAGKIDRNSQSPPLRQNVAPLRGQSFTVRVSRKIKLDTKAIVLYIWDKKGNRMKHIEFFGGEFLVNPKQAENVKMLVGEINDVKFNIPKEDYSKLKEMF